MSTAAFDLTAPLPEEPLVIEASAGTGKTYTLTALATRYLAETDIRASDLLIVTFTRAATAELRERLRARLVEAASVIAGRPDPASLQDPLLAHLAGLPEPALDRAIRNLDRAVVEFDTATISTIHGFATQVLGLLGLSDDADGGFVDDTGALTLSVCADVLAAAAGSGTPADLLPSYAQLVGWTQTMLGRPGVEVRPEPDDAGDDRERAAAYGDLVQASLDSIRSQRRRLGQRSFGDLLTLLQDELHGDRAEVAAQLIRNRYRVALIDEFQDTDPVQWDIFSTLFGQGDLVLVGDPKQAIYAFRGADIHTYVSAVDAHEEGTRSLGVNWRSDGAVLAAVDTLLDGVTFGDPSIRFQPVRAGGAHETRRLVDRYGEPLPALDLRVRTNRDIKTTRAEYGEQPVEAAAARNQVFQDLSNRLRELFETARLPVDKDHEPETGGPPGTRAVRPSDVAVLVRSRTEAEAIRERLVADGIPAVLARGSSVLESPAATQWRWLLSALQRPSDHRRARMFALSWFVGEGVVWLDRADDEAIAALQDQLWAWSDTLHRSGIDAFLRQVVSDSGVIERVLARADGDRCVTDLEHIAELFRTERPTGHVSVAGLLSLLDPDNDDKVQANPNADKEGDDSSRRVESEADAVQIMTVWVAKGLEFSIVCCPTMWSAGASRDAQVYRDDEGRALDVLHPTPWPDRAITNARKESAEAERSGEALRLLYVALTRARHQTILWWVRGKGSLSAPLAKVLFSRGFDGRVEGDLAALKRVEAPTDDKVVAYLEQLIERSVFDGRPTLAVTDVGKVEAPASRWRPPHRDVPATDLRTATLAARPERRTERWSFSSISARAADTHTNIDHPDQAATLDEPAPITEPVTEPVVVPIADALDAPGVSALAPLPASAAFGLLVHSIYEHVDFTSQTLAEDVRDRLHRELAWRTIGLTPALLPDATEADGHDRLVAGIVGSIETPLGTDLGDRRLADLSRADRLDELDFELRLADPAAGVTDRRIGEILLTHLPADDPFRDWAQQLASGCFDAHLGGHLTGSIDIVLRLTDPAGGADRYVIVDYKTNRLHDPTAPPKPDDYAPARLYDEMAHHHYPLQALLYSVALHRYLRWRLPDYDPAANLAGARYLFVRGMSGADVHRSDDLPHGVCRWDLPPAAVVAVSDLLAGVTDAVPDPVTYTGGPAIQPSLFDEVSS